MSRLLDEPHDRAQHPPPHRSRRPAVAREVQPGPVRHRARRGGRRADPALASPTGTRETGTVTVVVHERRQHHRTGSPRSPAGAEVPTVVGPLGNPTEIEQFGTVLCVGGCYGIGSIYPIARALKEKGNRVVTVDRGAELVPASTGRRGSRAVSDQLVFITRDGSEGLAGHVGRLPEIIERSSEPVHRVIVNGCTFLMKRGSDATRPLGIKTIVSLNPIMIDGTGMCGVCRVTVGGADEVRLRGRAGLRRPRGRLGGAAAAAQDVPARRRSCRCGPAAARGTHAAS